MLSGQSGEETAEEKQTSHWEIRTLHTCTVSGLANAEKLMEDIKAGRVSYDFVEVMACPGGCVGGGGQPIHDGCEFAERRGGTLYRLDR